MQQHATALIVLVHDAPRTAIMNPPAFSRSALNIADQRRDYARAELTETDVDADPLLQFERWLADQDPGLDVPALVRALEENARSAD